MDILKHKYYDRKDKNDPSRHWTDPDDEDDKARQKYEQHILQIKSTSASPNVSADEQPNIPSGTSTVVVSPVASTPIGSDQVTPISTPIIAEIKENSELPVASASSSSFSTSSSPLLNKNPRPKFENSVSPNADSIITKTDIKPSKTHIPKDSPYQNQNPTCSTVFQEPIREDQNVIVTTTTFTSHLESTNSLFPSSTMEPSSEINESSESK
ncbi:hypothetical protein PIROE2DRAFT_5409, partial [Piromyces sp. E2]